MFVHPSGIQKSSSNANPTSCRGPPPSPPERSSGSMRSSLWRPTASDLSAAARLPPALDRRNSQPPWPFLFQRKRPPGPSAPARPVPPRTRAGVPPGCPGIRTASHPVAPSGLVSPLHRAGRCSGPGPPRRRELSSARADPRRMGVGRRSTPQSNGAETGPWLHLAGPGGGEGRLIDGWPPVRSLSRGSSRTSQFRAGTDDRNLQCRSRDLLEASRRGRHRAATQRRSAYTERTAPRPAWPLPTATGTATVVVVGGNTGPARRRDGSRTRAGCGRG